MKNLQNQEAAILKLIEEYKDRNLELEESEETFEG